MLNIKPILTIAVPTYNRIRQLEVLFNSFLSKVDTNYSDCVEIIILDNSDIKESEYNKGIFYNTSIIYSKNSINIGYSKNIINCVKRAKGEFLWLISDDDYVDFNVFCKLIAYLKNGVDNNIKCVMLPFVNKDFLGDKSINNTANDWGVSDITNLTEMIVMGEKLPFILFSSAVVRLGSDNLAILDELEAKYINNDYIQIAVFLELIGMTSDVIFYGYSLQIYNQSYEIRFDMSSMRKSYRAILSAVSSECTEINENLLIKRDDYRWLGWSLWSYIRLVSMPGAKSYRNELVSSVYRSSSIKNITLSLMFYVPASLLRRVYILIYSFKSAYKNKLLTSEEVKLKVRILCDIGK